MKKRLFSSTLLGLTALLGACNPGPPPGPNTLEAGTVSGSLSSYTGGAAQLYAYAPLLRELLAEGTVAANGKFSVTLPTTPGATQLQPIAGEGCTAQPTVTPAHARFVFTDTYMVAREEELVGYTEEITNAGQANGTGRSDVLRFYASTAARVTGQFICGGTTSRFDLDLKAGWNVVQRTVLAVSGDITTSQTFGMYSGERITTPFTPVAPPAQPLSVQIPSGSVSVVRGQSVKVEALVTTPEGATGNVSVELLDPPPGFVLETSTLAASARSAQGPSTLGALALQKGNFPSRLAPQATRTSVLTLRTTAEAERTNTGLRSPHPLRLRFSHGEQHAEATLYVHVEGQGVRTEFRDAEGTYTAQGLTLGAGQTGKLTAIITPQSGLTGEVRLSLNDPATGIKGQGGPVTVGAGSQSLPFSITVPATTASGTYALPVFATHAAGTEKVGTLNVVVVAPTVQLTAPPVTVYGGETVTLPVTVESQHGFEGEVTLRASDLPAGVTATPVKVTVPKGGAVAASLQLTGAETLGSVSSATLTLKAEGTNLSASGAATLSLRPRRFLLGPIDVVSMTAARGGFWFTGQPEGQSGAAATLARFDGQAVVESVKLPLSGSFNSWRLVTAPGGEVWGLQTSGERAFRYADGKLQTWNLNLGSPASTVADGQGGLWFIAHDAASGEYRLQRLSAATGEVQVMSDQKFSVSAMSGLLARSADGKTLYVAAEGTLLRVDAASGKTTPLSLPGLTGLTALAVDASGTLWAYGRTTDFNTRLGRLNTDGTVNLYPLALGDMPEVFGFDGQGLLWGAGGWGTPVRAFDPKTGQEVRTIPVPSEAPVRFALNPSGGVWATWNDHAAKSAYTSLLR